MFEIILIVAIIATILYFCDIDLSITSKKLRNSKAIIKEENTIINKLPEETKQEIKEENIEEIQLTPEEIQAQEELEKIWANVDRYDGTDNGQEDIE